MGKSGKAITCSEAVVWIGKGVGGGSHVVWDSGLYVEGWKGYDGGLVCESTFCEEGGRRVEDGFLSGLFGEIFFSSSSGEVKADFLFCRILRPWRMLSKKSYLTCMTISKRIEMDRRFMK